jgi:hypothetical protein
VLAAADFLQNIVYINVQLMEEEKVISLLNAVTCVNSCARIISDVFVLKGKSYCLSQIHHNILT